MSRRVAFAAVLVLVVLAAAYLTSARRTEGPPLDPRSTAADGARAVVELTDRFGAGMELVDGVPDASVDTALLLQDRYDREDADAVRAWVRAGGTLVVADPGSTFTPPVAGAATDVVTGGCPVPALAAVRTVDVGVGRRYVVRAGDRPCFADRDGAVVVVSALGQGTVVSVGGPDVFTNHLLAEQDNAVLAVSLLAPTPSSRSAFLLPVVVGSGDEGLLDLVGDPVWAALAQLVVAFVVVVAWRARRLGRPVAEPQPVAIESAELTRAVGRLLEQNRRPSRAAAVLRDRARRELSGPLGLPLDAPVDLVVTVLVERTSASADEVRRAVASPVTTADDLVAVANLLVRIRQEITHGGSHRVPV